MGTFAPFWAFFALRVESGHRHDLQNQGDARFFGLNVDKTDSFWDLLAGYVE